ncbi:MAG: class I SAM-dependent methyltransferase [Phenylobacterium sp.]|nr:class I SAM-dependent methyltransferase [Phenylobacterium sp.]
MAKAKSYYTPGSLSAAHYDAVTAADDRLAGDGDIYAGLAPPGGSILELGAGSGRLTCDLASRGFWVTGVDIAPAMLAQAEARRAKLPPDAAARCRLVRGDMTALKLGGAFDLVICPFFTLAHIPAGAAWRNAFQTMARHLSPGGLAAVHLPRREIMSLPGPTRPDLPVMDLAIEGGRRLRLYVRERTFREDLGKLDQVLEYELVDAGGQVVARSPERLTYWTADPAPFAITAGFEVDRAAVPLGGVGDIWIFRRSSAGLQAAP